jgi:hypothetical protein
MTLAELHRRARAIRFADVDIPIPDTSAGGLREQVLRTKAVMDAASPQDIKVARSYDANEVAPVVEFAQQHLGVPNTPSLAEEIDAFVQRAFIDPFILRAKQDFAVPRPHVLAARFGVRFKMPVESAWLSVKSYPSGHAGGSRLAAHVLTRLYGAHPVTMLEFADSVALSRMQIGAHTPQDILAAQVIADQFFELLTLRP